MEVISTVIIILLVIVFGVGTIDNALKTSERGPFDKTDVKYNDGDNT